MDTFKTIAVVILSISFVLFTALFGRLPALRKTPIGFLYRVLWKHLPNAFIKIDDLLTGRRLSRGLTRTGNFLMNEKHPLVLIFFLLLQFVGEVLFIPYAWPQLPSSIHKVLIPVFISAPYISLYYSCTVSNNITNPEAHHSAMLAYPYDFTLFHPGYYCSTCHRSKPPRSKHCSLCKSCVQKQDHHCIWINNCVGRNNYLWFNLLLISTSILLAYGAGLGYTILDAKLQRHFVPPALTRGSISSKRWSTRMDWKEFARCWGWVISAHWQIGATTLLMTMSCPLALAFLGYHVYLIWAGMTTNESAKWSDWREDIADGLVYRAELEVLRSTGYKPLPEDVEPRSEDVRWPRRARAKWWVIVTRNGEMPTRKNAEGREEVDDRWVKVNSLAEIENIYDLGFWENLVEALMNRD